MQAVTSASRPRSCVEFRRSLPYIITPVWQYTNGQADFNVSSMNASSGLGNVFIYSIPSVIGFNCEPLKLARPEIAYLLCNLYGLTGGACRLNHVCFSLWIWPKGSPIHRTPNFFRAQNDSFWKELVLVFQFILTDMISSSSRLVVMKSLSISAELLTKRQLKPHFNFQFISGMFPKTLSRIGLATFR